MGNYYLKLMVDRGDPAREIRFSSREIAYRRYINACRAGYFWVVLSHIKKDYKIILREYGVEIVKMKMNHACREMESI